MSCFVGHSVVELILVVYFLFVVNLFFDKKVIKIQNNDDLYKLQEHKTN